MLEHAPRACMRVGIRLTRARVRLAWTKAEDARIVQSVQHFGLKWGKISELLPGRTAHAIRNRFHRLQQLQAEQAAVAASAAASKEQASPITSWSWENMTE